MDNSSNLIARDTRQQRTVFRTIALGIVGGFAELAKLPANFYCPTSSCLRKQRKVSARLRWFLRTLGSGRMGHGSTYV